LHNCGRETAKEKLSADGKVTVKWKNVDYIELV
jgi:hypothetical protein